MRRTGVSRLLLIMNELLYEQGFARRRIGKGAILPERKKNVLAALLIRYQLE
jgi:hypothetical protein